jgi:hypothetical protein
MFSRVLANIVVDIFRVNVAVRVKFNDSTSSHLILSAPASTHKIPPEILTLK